MKNVRKQKFTEEYSKNGNAAKAARAAGYSEKTAKAIGSKLLKDKEVKAALKQTAEQSKKAAAWNLDRAVEELEANMLFARACEKPESINKGIELICKLKGLFAPEKQEITLEGGKHILTFKELCENEQKRNNMGSPIGKASGSVAKSKGSP